MAEVMLDCVESLEAAVTSVEAVAGEVADAAGLVEALVPLERRLAAARSALAARAAEQQVHRRTGHKDEVQWLARTTGVSRRSAREQLDTARRLQDLPVVREAMGAGQLSEAQAQLVARAAEADPARQKQLLGTAKREDLKGLKGECDRVIAAADDDEAATHARVKAKRSVRFWREHDGTHAMLAKGTAEDVGALKSRIDKQADAVMAQARRAGRRQPYEAYQFDALAQLVGHDHPGDEPADQQPKFVPPRRELLIHIDYSAAKRGHTLSGETCEIAGVGPVPVEVALDFDTDPFIKAVIRDGTDIKTVVHYGRSVPAELRTALEARGLLCAVPGCSNDAHLEIDHALVDHAAGGPLALWNTQYLCSHHHRLKTQGLLDVHLPPPADSRYHDRPPGDDRDRPQLE